MSKKYEVVSLDLPCFGESDVTDNDWSMDDYVDLLISFIEERHLENIILIGHSLGGLISLYLSFDSLVLIFKQPFGFPLGFPDIPFVLFGFRFCKLL